MKKFKHLRNKVTMATINANYTEKNITVSRSELQEERKALAGAAGSLVHNLSSNRQQRRKELKDAKFQAAHPFGNIESRAVINNRKAPTKRSRVYLKMAHFYMALRGGIEGVKP